MTEVFPIYMAQVQRRSPLEEGCSFIGAINPPSVSQASTCCGEYPTPESFAHSPTN
jgi:hypothetical protein